MIPFERYPSIENSYREKMIHKIELMGIAEWVAHEKIHGANFSIWYDGTEVKFGKRSGFIGEGADFFKFQKLIPELTELARDTWKHYHLKDGQNLVIYGELFGGMYPHPDVERMLDVSKIQDTVYYSPDVQFRYFDIMIDGEYIPPNLWMASNYLVPFIATAKFLETLLDYDVERPSFVPAELGLPRIEGNKMEGIVMRPYRTTAYLPTGERVILKKKSAKFSERSIIPKLRANPTDNIPAEVMHLYDHVSGYINDARLDSVVSKMGPVTIKDFKNVRQQLYEDAILDFNLDNGPALLGDLVKEHAKTLHKALGARTAEVTKEYLTRKT